MKCDWEPLLDLNVQDVVLMRFNPWSAEQGQNSVQGPQGARRGPGGGGRLQKERRVSLCNRGISLGWSLPVPLAGPAAFSSCSAGSIP